MALDPDDSAAILLHYGMADLHAACELLAEPHQGWLEFVGLVVAGLRHHPEAWEAVEQLCLSAARMVAAEIRSSL